jgi:catalase (peroxidase I)
MALNADTWKNALKPLIASGLKTIYGQMHDGDTSKDDNWFAEQIAALLADAIAVTGTAQIKSADVDAGISVTIPVTSPEGSPSAGQTDKTGTLS